MILLHCSHNVAQDLTTDKLALQEMTKTLGMTVMLYPFSLIKDSKEAVRSKNTPSWLT